MKQLFNKRTGQINNNTLLREAIANMEDVWKLCIPLKDKFPLDYLAITRCVTDAQNNVKEFAKRLHKKCHSYKKPATELDIEIASNAIKKAKGVVDFCHEVTEEVDEKDRKYIKYNLREALDALSTNKRHKSLANKIRKLKPKE